MKLITSNGMQIKEVDNNETAEKGLQQFSSLSYSLS